MACLVLLWLRGPRNAGHWRVQGEEGEFVEIPRVDDRFMAAAEKPVET